MAAKAKAPTAAPTSADVDSSSAVYLAVEALREYVSSAFVEFENDGQLAVLQDQLGYIRDRADAIQSAVIGILDAQRNHL